MPQAPKTKSEMYQLWNQGVFGNRPQVWLDYKAYISSGFAGDIMLRYKEPQSRFCSEITRAEDVAQVRTDWLLLGADLDKITYGEAITGTDRRFQGEIKRSERFLDLTCSYLPLIMRQALAQGAEYYSGLRALGRLVRDMPPEDLEWLWYLLENWDGCVVEFSVFNRGVGVLGKRTIFWECRGY